MFAKVAKHEYLVVRHLTNVCVCANGLVGWLVGSMIDCWLIGVG